LQKALFKGKTNLVASMNRIWLLVLAALLASACILPVAYFSFQTKTDPQSLNLFFGVSFGGNTTSEAKLLIDRVKSYTNLFVINSWQISGAGNASASMRSAITQQMRA